MNSLKALLCIPTFNEKENLLELTRQIQFYGEGSGIDFWILIIDDSSPDGTGILADEIARTNERVKVLHRSGKLGLASAYIQGFQMALGGEFGIDFDWFMEMDADFSHDPVHLREFAHVLSTQKLDVVCGSRYIEGGSVENWSERRYLLSRAGSLYAKFWLGFDVTDWTGGFNAWSKATLQKLELETLRSKGYAFQIEMKYRSLVRSAKFKEIPICFKERRSGVSKMSGSIVKEALLGVAELRFRFESGHLFSKT